MIAWEADNLCGSKDRWHISSPTPGFYTPFLDPRVNLLGGQASRIGRVRHAHQSKTSFHPFSSQGASRLNKFYDALVPHQTRRQNHKRSCSSFGCPEVVSMVHAGARNETNEPLLCIAGPNNSFQIPGILYNDTRISST